MTPILQRKKYQHQSNATKQGAEQTSLGCFSGSGIIDAWTHWNPVVPHVLGTFQNCPAIHNKIVKNTHRGAQGKAF